MSPAQSPNYSTALSFPLTRSHTALQAKPYSATCPAYRAGMVTALMRLRSSNVVCHFLQSGTETILFHSARLVSSGHSRQALQGLSR